MNNQIFIGSVFSIKCMVGAIYFHLTGNEFMQGLNHIAANVSILYVLYKGSKLT